MEPEEPTCSSAVEDDFFTTLFEGCSPPGLHHNSEASDTCTSNPPAAAGGDVEEDFDWNTLLLQTYTAGEMASVNELLATSNNAAPAAAGRDGDSNELPVDVEEDFDWNTLLLQTYSAEEMASGGVWCNTIESCTRHQAPLGSSKYMEPQNGTKLYFRGQRIWELLMEELLSLGMSNAEQYMDRGFTLKDVSGNYTMRSFYGDVLGLQMDKAGFPCYLLVTDPQCKLVSGLFSVIYFSVIDNNSVCFLMKLSKTQRLRLSLWIQLMIFGSSLLKSLSDFVQNSEGAVFINSCFIHCQTWVGETWHSPTSPKIGNKTTAESVGDWYFNRKVVKHTDCPYPCNPTCYDMDFTQPR
ncbi:hypothetical protein Tsubulata_014898 [Turnera subulata]|uniref:Pectin acetylesterase n=1 Tax=Turnera subulata TaxID=218843 RepID=A0A9Q0G3U3_9ROSI|nr:hypothetical protein Tsubulata_014898 [Turnera subulata]